MSKCKQSSFLKELENLFGATKVSYWPESWYSPMLSLISRYKIYN